MAEFITIEVQGLKEALRMLEQGQRGVERELRDAVNRVLLMLQDRIAKYPPPPAGSTYRRTGTLGRRWTTAQPHIFVQRRMIEGVIGNNTEYAPYVQSRSMQAWMHRGRWQTIEDVVERSRDEAQRILEGAVTRALEGG